MVVLAGFESFISRLGRGQGRGRLEWTGRVDFGDLKLLAPVVAIAAIHLLEGF